MSLHASDAANVVEVTDPGARSSLCASILAELPDWFGIEEATAAFYEARGFVPLEELLDLWEANPCLLMVKRL